MTARFVSAAVLAGALAAPASAEELRLMTGPQGGVWLPLGATLKALWEKSMPGLSFETLPGAGIFNVRAIESGRADIGFGNSITTADAIAGRAPFKQPYRNVCNVATLYPQYFQVVVLADAGIDALADLKGKTMTTQVRGNTTELITEHILNAGGLSYKDVKVRFATSAELIALMQGGQAQAFTLGTIVPSAAVMELAGTRDIKLLDLTGQFDAMHKINPGYTLVTIKAGTYAKQAKDVKVIGYATHVIASCKLAEDRVYAMTKIMALHVRDIAAINSAMGDLTAAAMAEDIGVPLHPGAARFYREAGALK